MSPRPSSTGRQRIRSSIMMLAASGMSAPGPGFWAVEPVQAHLLDGRRGCTHAGPPGATTRFGRAVAARTTWRPVIS